MLVYDGDCGFCRRSLGWLRRLGATCAAQPWQATDLAAVGLTEDLAREAAWFVDGERTFRGHEAVGRALETSRWRGVRLLGCLLRSRALRPVAAPAYAWVAANRHRLPGTTDACGVD